MCTCCVWEIWSWIVLLLCVVVCSFIYVSQSTNLFIHVQNPNSGTACLDMDSKPTTNTIGNSNATSVEVNTRKRPIGVIESEMNTRNGAIDYCKAMSMDSIADEQSLNKYKKFEGDVSINTNKTSVTTTSLLCDNNTDANGLSNASVVLDKLAQYQANVGNMLLSVDEKPHLPQ